MNFNIDLTTIAQWFTGLVFAFMAHLIKSKVIPYLREKGLYSFTERLVKAVSTMFPENYGKEKFEWVFKKLQNSRYGKYFDEETLKATIQGEYVKFKASIGEKASPMVSEDE